MPFFLFNLERNDLVNLLRYCYFGSDKIDGLSKDDELFFVFEQFI